MTLDDYLASRFGPVLSELAGMGYPTEELEAALKRGVVWQLMSRLRYHKTDSGLDCVGVFFNYAGSGDFHFNLHGERYPGKYGLNIETLDEATPDDIFPHLSHLVEQEALT